MTWAENGLAFAVVAAGLVVFIASLIWSPKRRGRRR